MTPADIAKKLTPLQVVVLLATLTLILAVLAKLDKGETNGSH